MEALQALGYPQPQARRAVESARRSGDPGATLEALVREALRSV
ncbi:MAG: hypothetical protein ACREKE_01460 [bacterium]